eukprot:3363265-Rhodomonas_salina.3
MCLCLAADAHKTEKHTPGHPRRVTHADTHATLLHALRQRLVQEHAADPGRRAAPQRARLLPPDPLRLPSRVVPRGRRAARVCPLQRVVQQARAWQNAGRGAAVRHPHGQPAGVHALPGPRQHARREEPEPSLQRARADKSGRPQPAPLAAANRRPRLRGAAPERGRHDAEDPGCLVGTERKLRGV